MEEYVWNKESHIILLTKYTNTPYPMYLDCCVYNTKYLVHHWCLMYFIVEVFEHSCNSFTSK